MENGEQRKIKLAVLQWIDGANETQKTVADKLKISPPSLNQMLNTDKALPLPRFLQLVHILRPGQAEVNRVWGMYLAELNIPAENLLLVTKSSPVPQQNTRKRVHELVDQLPEEQLVALKTLLEGMVENA